MAADEINGRVDLVSCIVCRHLFGYVQTEVVLPNPF